MAQSRGAARSCKNKTAAIITHAGARFCNQIVFAGEPLTIAVRNVQFIATKQTVIGIMTQCNVGRCTNGKSRTRAKHARQNAIAAPLDSRGQPFSKVVCVKNPLLLQRTAATTTRMIPVILCPVRLIEIAGSFVDAMSKVFDSSRWKTECKTSVLYQRFRICERRCYRELVRPGADRFHRSRCGYTSRRPVGRTTRRVRNSARNLVGIADLFVPTKIGATDRTATFAATRCNRCDFMAATCIAWCSDVAYTVNAIVESCQKVGSPSLTACASCESQQQAG